MVQAVYFHTPRENRVASKILKIEKPTRGCPSRRIREATAGPQEAYEPLPDATVSRAGGNLGFIQLPSDGRKGETLASPWLAAQRTDQFKNFRFTFLVAVRLSALAAALLPAAAHSRRLQLENDTRFVELGPSLNPIAAESLELRKA